MIEMKQPATNKSALLEICKLLSFVYLAHDAHGAPDSVCRDLRSGGNSVIEASSVHEALWLCAQHYLSTVIVSATFDDHQLHELRQRYVTIKLKHDTRSSDVLGELARAS
jgi:hypothetical protein